MGEHSSQICSVGSQPSDEKRELAPSSYVKKPTWYEMTLKDAQEQAKVPRSTVRERRLLKIQMALMCIVIDDELSSIEEAINQQVWQDAMI